MFLLWCRFCHLNKREGRERGASLSILNWDKSAYQPQYILLNPKVKVRYLKLNGGVKKHET
jgi:hypothetical protein